MAVLKTTQICIPSIQTQYLPRIPCLRRPPARRWLSAITQTFPPLFSTFLGRDLDIDPLQSTTGTGGKSNTLVPDCRLIPRGHQRVTFFVWLASREATRQWLAGGNAYQMLEKEKWANRSWHRGRGLVRRGWGGWGGSEARRGGGDRGLSGINAVWQAGRDKHTNTQELLWRAALLNTHNARPVWEQGERETIDKRANHREGMHARAGEEEKRARLGTTGAPGIILLRRERETPFAARNGNGNSRTFHIGSPTIIQPACTFAVEKTIGATPVQRGLENALSRGTAQFFIFPQDSFVLRRARRETWPSPRLESAAPSFICIPQIPWLVGALIPWHIAQLDPRKARAPTLWIGRHAAGVPLRTDCQGFSERLHIAPIRCLRVRKCGDVAGGQSKSERVACVSNICGKCLP